jgi:tetratricopeptide (TPR) repeat protein
MTRDSFDWKKCVSRGKYLLSARRPDDAFACFEEAIRDCPADDPEALADILYHCGLSLEELGVSDEAVRCWKFSLRYFSATISDAKAAPAGKKLLSYGSRGTTKEEKDCALFSAVQRAKYFHQVQSNGYRNDAEFRRIEAIIGVYWQELRDSGLLDLIQHNDKIALFYEVRIDFFGDGPESAVQSPETENIIPFHGEKDRFR